MNSEISFLLHRMNMQNINLIPQQSRKGFSLFSLMQVSVNTNIPMLIKIKNQTLFFDEQENKN